MRRSDLLQAIGANPSAPADVLLRLLADKASKPWDQSAWVWWRREFPEKVVDAIVAHPERQIRKALAENGFVSGEIRARLIDDSDKGVRLFLAIGPNVFRLQSAPLPEWAQRRLIDDPHELVRSEALGSHYISRELLADLAGHEDADKRRAACRAWDLLDATTRARLLADEDDRVRGRAAEAACPDDPDATDVYIAHASGAGSRAVFYGDVLKQALIHRSTAERLAREGTATERAAIAGNPRIPKDIAQSLAADAEHGVRLMAASRPDLSEDERAMIDYHVGVEDRLNPLRWARELADPEEIRRFARSANILIRRSLAYNKNLPQDVVELLSTDDDFPVRILLCENQPTVNGEVVLDVFLNWKSVVSAALQGHPNFPREQLAARFADDPDEHKRWLIYNDPTAPADVVLQLSRDPNVNVRRSIAGHANLPPERLGELLNDPDDGIAERAARNTSLPHEAMRRLLDQLDVPDAESSPSR